MRLVCNAKINLGLSITEKRNDGFHNLESLFLPIDWCDIIEIEESSKTVFTSSGIKIDGSQADNLCLQAYHLLAQEFLMPPVSIHLEKRIPIGAGLGGGSSDAAFVLKGLNELFRLNLSTEKLLSLAATLGSDCPFFIENKAAFASGRGELLDNTIDLDLNAFCLIVNPGIHISTAKAYGSITPKTANFDLRQINSLPIEKWQQNVQNDFEIALLPQFPQLKKLKDDLLELNPFYVSMSGSGSSFFALFHDKPGNYDFGNYASKLVKLQVNQ